MSGINNSKVSVEMKDMQHTVDDDRFQAGRVATMAAGHALHDTYTAFLAPMLPLFITNLSLSKAKAGLLIVFIQGPSMIQPIVGHWADRVNLYYIVYLAPAITATLMSLLFLFDNYTMLALLLILVGFSSAAFHAIGPVIAGKLSGRSIGMGMSFWMVGGELGRVLGPVIIVASIQLLTQRGIPYLMIGGFILSFVLFLRLRDMRLQPHHPQRSISWRSQLGRMKSILVPLTVLIFVRAFMMAALTIYLPTFLIERGENLWFAGISLSVVQGAGVVGAFFGGSISDRLGRRLILFISTLCVPFLMLIFLIAGDWFHFPVLVAMGFSLISMTPVIMALVQESFPENRAFANGVYMCLSFVLRSVVTVLVGALGDFFGLPNAFLASAIVLFLGLPFIFFLPKGRESRGTQQKPFLQET
jgi:FSR family fosmidomycin resistance protein-like MFS transporter